MDRRKVFLLAPQARIFYVLAMSLKLWPFIGFVVASSSAYAGDPVVPKEAKTIQIWALGDSTAQPIGQGLERNLRDLHGLAVHTYFRNSSGLARREFYDWPKVAAELLRSRTPDIAVITFGANDTQGLVIPGRLAPALLHTTDWQQEYEHRAADFVRLFTEKGVRVYLVLQPYDPSRKYASSMSDINEALRAASSRVPGVALIDTPRLLAGEHGEYTNMAIDSHGQRFVLRAEDGLHLTGMGGGYVARRILRALERDALVPPHTSGLDAEGRALDPSTIKDVGAARIPQSGPAAHAVDAMAGP
jgi:uncharacterized protein